MRNEAVGVILAIAIAVSGVLGFFAGQLSSGHQPSGVQSFSSTSNTGGCTVQGTTIGVVLRVLSGSNPVAGATVNGESVGYCNDIREVMPFHLTVTNSTGWANLLDGGFGVYDININYSRVTYHISLPVEPLAATYAIFDTATGNTTTDVCTDNQHCRLPSSAVSQSCKAAAQLQGLPIPTGRWFTARVDYRGPWEATAVVYDHGSSVFASCYVGSGQGFFEYLSANISKNASILITAVKLDNGTGSLFAAVNGKANSTSLPYGMVTVRAPANY